MHMNCIPTEWWKIYGAHKNLQNIAIKVLSLTCSSSGCELHHPLRRSRLEHQKLQNLVYVKYNQALYECYECHDLIDPIALNNIDNSNEWIVGELDGEGDDAEDELVFDDDDTAEPLKYTRRQTQMQKIVVASTSNKEKGKEVVEEEDADELSQDEGEEEYNYSCNKSDEDNDIELEEDKEDY
ncbi:hypothetical protein CR513_01742, partial [Mucuna pruriens]